MEGTYVRTPGECTPAERAAFARMVLEGFGSRPDTLDDRIGASRLLSWCHGPDGAMAAVAALKGPPEEYREHVFAAAGSPIGPASFRFELGWVYVLPRFRGRGFGEHLCARLVDLVNDTPLFSTTRPDNAPMIRILRRVGFNRVGHPFPRRQEQMSLFLR